MVRPYIHGCLNPIGLNWAINHKWWSTKHSGKLFGYSTKITPHVFQHYWMVPSLLNQVWKKATMLNNYFYTCFNHCQPPLLDPPENLFLPDDCPSELLCSEESVIEHLSYLDTTKSTGTDRISSKMLRCTALSIADPLHKLFNLSISTGTLPIDWKVGRITPVPKGVNN